MTSSDLDLVVRGGKVVLPERVIEADIAVQGGCITQIGDLAGARSAAEVDARGRYVMAGMIDTHVHLREPGHPHRETFASGTRAAAIGGVTTVLEMPSGIPAVSSAESWRAKNELVAPGAMVDYALYGGAGASNLDQIVEQADAGAVAFKSFMNQPAPTADPGMLSRCLPDDATFLAAMERIATTGRVAVIHAENDSICSCLAREMRAAGRRDAVAHARSRPPYAESEAVSRALHLADVHGTRVSFAHVSTAAAVARVRAAKQAGQPVTAEACPHHLLLTEACLAELGPFAKINPPLRGEADRDAVWEALLDGTIDFIGTDHAPYTAEEKDVGWRDIWSSPSGVHGLESVVPLLLTEVNRGRITLPVLTRAISLRAAQTFGLHSRKGELCVGADADFIVVDLERRGSVDRVGMQSVSKEAARLWHGRETIGAVTATYVRGVEVARDGKVTGRPGFGRLVGPGAAA